ncbi:MAG: biopolymer transporter ExbD [Candidatus Cloacimonetes bacterium]|nr:biopolymer transporter ExbD [Candidatus Cloacimonadota bacterium]
MNLIPIMNLFIVVIPMLMLITVSVHMAMLQITLPSADGGGSSSEDQEGEKEKLIALFDTGFKIITPGGDAEDIDIPIRNEMIPRDEVFDRYNFSLLNEELLKINPPDDNQWRSVGVMPNPDTRYDLLLLVIDLCKKNHLEVTYKEFRSEYFRMAQ